MKTAEEWIRIYLGLSNKKPRLHGWIEQIQLDAMKEGMRRAAKQKNNGIECSCSTSLRDAILTAAEQLTIKDLS